MIRSRFHLIGLLALLGILGLGQIGLARACSLDNVPSISINGKLARLNTARPVRGHLAHWAPFVFSSAFKAGTSVKFTENLVDLHRSLLPDAFGKPWRWNFGDGSSGSGYAIQHVYKKPGSYKVIVSAYYSSNKAWFEFDAALIPVQ